MPGNTTDIDHLYVQSEYITYYPTALVLLTEIHFLVSALP